MQRAGRRAQLFRVVGVFVIIALTGALAGVGLAFVVPTSGLIPASRARTMLHADTATSLTSLAALAENGDPSYRAAAALALALLFTEHAGAGVEKERAAASLKTAVAAVRNAPEALYARAVLHRLGVDDETLDDDIAKRAEEHSKSPWWQVARGVRAVAAQRPDEATQFLQRAALGRDAPLHAQALFARHLIARGEIDGAQAIAARIVRHSPEHAQGRILAALAAVVEDAREESPEERAIKLKKLKQKGAKRRDGPPRAGETHETPDAPLLALWHTPQEEDALAQLDKMDERDGGLVAVFLETLASARGDVDLAEQLRLRVVEVASRHPGLASRQIELSLLAGDLTTAGELLKAVETGAGERELALHRARLQALRLLPEDELRRRTAGNRSLRNDALVFPFGTATLDPWAPVLPFRVVFDPAAVPDAAFLASFSTGATGADLEKRFAKDVLLFKAERALARGDLSTAAEVVREAGGRASGDPRVLLVDARLRMRQGDRDGARLAIDSAVALAADDPGVLLAAARSHYDGESYIPARKVLRKLDELGFKSPTALALDAMLDARAGDSRKAQAGIAEAQRMGAHDVELLGATVLILRDGKDLDAARTAASRLFAVDGIRTNDPILRVWQADAAFRAGEVARAEAVLDDVIATRPTLADAHLVRGVIVAQTRPQEAVARFTEAIRLAPKSAVAAEASKRRSALNGAPAAGASSSGKRPAATPPRKRGR